MVGHGVGARMSARSRGASGCKRWGELLGAQEHAKLREIVTYRFVELRIHRERAFGFDAFSFAWVFPAAGDERGPSMRADLRITLAAAGNFGAAQSGDDFCLCIRALDRQFGARAYDVGAVKGQD